MKLKEGIIAYRVLSREFGWAWPKILINSLKRKNELFRNTKWSKIKTEESEFVKRLPLVAALYLELIRRSEKETAMNIMRSIIVPIGLNESMTGFQTLEDHHTMPMEHLINYLDYIDEKGAGRFCNRKYQKKDHHICHRVVTKCPFHDFFIEAGTPELTQLFCEVDRVFYEKAFPEFLFHRGDSWENTIAYGKDHCDFIFELKTDACS
jgi:hypothetical protein